MSFSLRFCSFALKDDASLDVVHTTLFQRAAIDVKDGPFLHASIQSENAESDN